MLIGACVADTVLFYRRILSGKILSRCADATLISCNHNSEVVFFWTSKVFQSKLNWCT